MLFLLKRRASTALAGLAILALIGLGLRSLLTTGPDYGVSFRNLLLGVVLFLLILASDGLIHFFLSRFFEAGYRLRYADLARVFKGQSVAAMVAGAAMAGIGEELLFRGLTLAPLGLLVSSLAFGLLHHMGRRFWPFTIWSGYQGLLLAAGVYLTDALVVTMVAHFLHDLCGFIVFWYYRERALQLDPGSR